MATHSGRTVFVRNIPFKASNEDLSRVFEDDGPLKHCFVVKEKGSTKCRGFGYVTFALKEDAEKAVEAGRKLEGRKLTLSFADSNFKKSKKKVKVQEKAPVDDKVLVEVERDEVKKKEEVSTKVAGKKVVPPSLFKSPKQRKKCKVIVRNLSFKCNEESLKAAFLPFGEVTEVNIPKKPDGRMQGYGFVQLNNIPNAAKAIKAMNGKSILGRPVAVDWAVARDKYLDAQQQKTKPVENAPSQSPVTAEEGGTAASSDEESDDDIQPEGMQQDSGKESSEDEANEDSTEEESDTGEEDDLESDDSGTNSIHSDESEEAETAGSKVKKKQSEDADEGKTIFIRNLAYDTEEEDLEDVFSEFGDVAYCRVVCDPDTEHSRGTAFVKFAEASAVEACLDKANSQEGGITVDGRPLILSLAVSHQKAQELAKAKKAKEESKDKRNLWLAREGLIRPGTQAAVGVEDADIKKRLKVENVKRQKLKNPNIFVSTTRLCFHNLPTNVDDFNLRKTILQKLEDKKARITECRVMRDLTRVNAKGVGKSRGYAFVNFTEHKHALQALRVLNNNPDVFGPNKRLIVEFSLENKAALAAKQKRLERHQAKQLAAGGAEVEGKKQQKKKPSLIPATVAPPSDKEGVKFKTTKPKHVGPKIRHKARPHQQQQKHQKTQKNLLKRPAEKPEKQKKNKRQKPSKERMDNFDNLVAKYRTALSKAGTQKSGGKWFDV